MPKARMAKANKPHCTRRTHQLNALLKRSQKARLTTLFMRLHKLCKISIESMLKTAKYDIITHQILSDHIVPARYHPRIVRIEQPSPR
jgi:hypothetical protein